MMRFHPVLLFVLTLAMALAACGGKSEEDQARDDGEELGKAIRSAFTVDSANELDDAVDDVSAAKDEVTANFTDDERQQMDQFFTDVDSAFAEIRASDDARDALRTAAEELPLLADELDALREGAGAEVRAALEGIREGLGF